MKEAPTDAVLPSILLPGLPPSAPPSSVPCPPCYSPARPRRTCTQLQMVFLCCPPALLLIVLIVVAAQLPSAAATIVVDGPTTYTGTCDDAVCSWLGLSCADPARCDGVLTMDPQESAMLLHRWDPSGLHHLNRCPRRCPVRV